MISTPQPTSTGRVQVPGKIDNSGVRERTILIDRLISTRFSLIFASSFPLSPCQVVCLTLCWTKEVNRGDFTLAGMVFVRFHGILLGGWSSPFPDSRQTGSTSKQESLEAPQTDSSCGTYRMPQRFVGFSGGTYILWEQPIPRNYKDLSPDL